MGLRMDDPNMLDFGDEVQQYDIPVDPMDELQCDSCQ